MKIASCLTLGASFAATALAASNAFTAPLGNITLQAGSTLDVTWANQSGSTVDLLLKQGDADNLHTVATIGSNIPNQGGVAWTVPTDLKTGQYALELEADGQDPNYTGFFTIIGQNTTSSSAESAKTTTTAGALVATGSHNATAASKTNSTSASATPATNATGGKNGTSGRNSSSPNGVAGGSNSTNSTAIGGSNNTKTSSQDSVGFGGLNGGSGPTSTNVQSTGAASASATGGSGDSAGGRAASGSAAASGSSGSSSSSSSGTKNGASMASFSLYVVTGALGMATYFML